VSIPNDLELVVDEPMFYHENHDIIERNICKLPVSAIAKTKM
jgi:hypothetical protein